PKIIAAAALAAVVVLAAVAGRPYFFGTPPPQNHLETPEKSSAGRPPQAEPPPGRAGSFEESFFGLLALLEPVIRAESPHEALSGETLALLTAMKDEAPYRQTPALRDLSDGAAAFLSGRLKEAERLFQAAAAVRPEEGRLVSFQAAASLRLGNTALAEELYLQALTLKSRQQAAPLSLSVDQLGRALCLFLLGRPDEAAPLAQAAWRTRHDLLGADDPQTVSAVNRLGAVLLALRRNDEAGALLRAAYLKARHNEKVGDALLEETRLLLTALEAQGGNAEEFGVSGLPPAADGEEEEEEGASTGEGQTAGGRAILPSPPPAAAEELAAWEDMADRLAEGGSPLAADLLTKIIVERHRLISGDLYQADLLPYHLKLVRANLAAGFPARAEEELRPLLGLESADFVELSSLMAAIEEAGGRYREAEEHWQAAADQADQALVDQKRDPEPELVRRSFDLHLRLAENLISQGRAPEEAEIELLGALRRLKAVQPDAYPDAGRVYLRLARLLKGIGRTKDSAVFYRKAQKLAESLLKKNPEGETRELLEGILQAVRAEGAPASKKGKEPATVPPEPAERPSVSADFLRLELAALGCLNRLDEFQARLEPALREAERLFGPASPTYMRYYSLRLKWLEEAGRVDELTEELTAQAQKPPGLNERERNLNRASALSYAARVNEKFGRPAAAVALYSQALECLSDSREAASGRRAALERALARLQAEAGPR
ncbi:MAG: hypothetical protein LBS31_12330, partial [Candidatus Adiutrix sp.]|nr:hypothetical protein [Candidatus Adiutrix sp.]